MPSPLILHGALGSHHQFLPLRERFDPGASILDFVGHGAAGDAAGPWTIDTFVDQLIGVLEASSASGPTAIFGYSMGGYVAMMAAMRRPDLVGRILTLGTKLAWDPATSRAETAKLDPETIVAKVPAFAADLERRHGAGRWRTMLAGTADLMVDLGEHPRLAPNGVEPLEQPVRLMVGDRDAMVSIDETVALARALRGGEVAVLPGTRHPIERVDLDLLAVHWSWLTQS